MDLQLKGKIVVITASTNGIGYASARMFLEEGAYVVINGRNEDTLQSKCAVLKKEFGDERVSCFCGDATKEKDIVELKNCVQKMYGKIDCLVANVGSGRPSTEDKLDSREWENSFQINLFSSVKLVHVFHDMWDIQKGGSIVLLSSLAACERIGAPYAYAAAKEGIKVLTKYLSDDYASKNIRVNCVIPGNVLFPGGRWEELIALDKEGIQNYIQKNVPMKRFAQPQEIAAAIVFLSSFLASFITGTSLVVDGGQKRGIS